MFSTSHLSHPAILHDNSNERPSLWPQAATNFHEAGAHIVLRGHCSLLFMNALLFRLSGSNKLAKCQACRCSWRLRNHALQERRQLKSMLCKSSLLMTA